MNTKLLEHIPSGNQNAVSVQRLAELTGARSERCLRADVRELRKAGELICSSPGGYYRPATRAEIADFIERMEGHAIGVFQAIKSAREAMKQMEGQQSFENL